jgi:hypothetical protein
MAEDSTVLQLGLDAQPMVSGGRKAEGALDNVSAKAKKATGILSKLDRGVQKLGKTFGSIKSFGTKMAIGVTAPITAIGIASLKAASDAQETKSKFNAVFKSLSGDADKWATSFAKSVGRSKTDIRGYMATLQDTFVPLGFARKEGAELSKQLTTLAVDLGSFNNMSDPEVLKSLQSAIVGNHESVRKFGVIINQAAIGQELLNMGVNGGVKAATEAEKAQARFNIILRSTKDAQGDAIRTSGEFANRLRAFKSRIRDVAEEIGMQLLPGAQKLIEFGTRLIDKWQGLDASTKKLVLVVAGLAAAIGPLLIAFGGIGLAATGVVAGLGLILSPIGLVIGGVLALTTAFILFDNKVKVVLKAAWSFIKVAFVAGIELLNAIGESIFSVLKRPWESMKLIGDLVSNALQGVWIVFKNYFGLLGDITVGLISIIKSPWEILKGVPQFLVGVFTSIWDVFKRTSELLGGWSVDLSTMISAAFSLDKDAVFKSWDSMKARLGEKIDEALGNVNSNLTSGNTVVIDTLKAVWETMAESTKSRITKTLSELGGLHLNMENATLQDLEGIWSHFIDNTTKYSAKEWSSLTTMFEEEWGKESDIVKKLKSLIAEAKGVFGEKIEIGGSKPTLGDTDTTDADIDKKKKKFGELTDFMKSAAHSAAGSIQTSLADFLFDPFKDGLKGMVVGFANAIRRMIAEMIAFAIIKNTLGKISMFAGFFGGAKDGGLATPQGFGFGGSVRGPGSGTSDSIPAMLSNGEFVMPASSVRHFGLDMMNSMKDRKPIKHIQHRDTSSISASMQQQPINLNIQNSYSNEQLAENLSNPMFKNILLNHVAANADEFRSVMAV